MSDERRLRTIIALGASRASRRRFLARGLATAASFPVIGAALSACSLRKKQAPTPTAPAAGSPAAAGSPTAPATNVAARTPTSGSSPARATPTAANAVTPSAAPSTGGADRGGVINISNTNRDTQVGNPILTSATTMLPYYLFDRLLVFDDTGVPRPQLASEWSFSPDNTVLTLTLRQARWHDGQPFTADDVLFTFDAIKDPKTDTTLRSRLQIGGEFVTWAKVDDGAVTLTLPKPFAPLLAGLNDVPIIPKHLLDGVPDINTDGFNGKPVGTGPFKLSEWRANQSIRLARNDDYWGGNVRPDGLSIVFNADTAAAIAALDAGDVDMLFVPPEAQSAFDNKPGVALHSYVYYTPITLAFNFKHALLQDPKVRQAIAMAIDKQSWADTVTQGRGKVANNQYAAGGPLDRFNDYANVKPVAFDVDAANALLDSAGYPMGNDGVRQAADGTVLTFNAVTFAGFPEYQNGLAILVELLQNIGIAVTANAVEYATLERMWADPSGNPQQRALELEEWPRPFEFDPDVYAELDSASFPPGRNYMWFKDDQCDQLIEQGRATTDPVQRVAIYQQLDQRRAEALPCVPLYSVTDAWATSDRVQGVANSPYFRRSYLINAKDWWKAT